MKANMVKKFFSKITSTVFCLLILTYSHCSWAEIEKYLNPIKANFYRFGTHIRVTLDLATEIATYLKDGRLGEIAIHGAIDDIALQLIIKSLRTNISLTMLNFECCTLGAEGGIALADMLRTNIALTTLNLGIGDIGNKGGIALADALQTNTALNTLKLRLNNIGVDGGIAMGKALQTNTALTTLDLRGNNIRTEGAIAIAGALLTNTALTTLTLINNNIGVDGGIAIGKALQGNTTLTTLELNDNPIGDESARAIAEALLTNTTLTTLNLANTNIHAGGGKALANALKVNTTLKTLILANNAHLGAEDGIAIAEALLTNTALTTLDLGGNVDIGTEGARAIVEALLTNTALTTLNLSHFNLGNGNTIKIEKLLSRNILLAKLLRKVKSASAFTIQSVLRKEPIGQVLPNILRLAGLDAHNRITFANTQAYNNEAIKNIIFRGSLEEVIRLFYHGGYADDYEEILTEVTQVRQLHREALEENHREIPEGLIELTNEQQPSRALITLIYDEPTERRALVENIFWGSV